MTMLWRDVDIVKFIKDDNSYNVSHIQSVIVRETANYSHLRVQHLC